MTISKKVIAVNHGRALDSFIQGSAFEEISKILS